MAKTTDDKLTARSVRLGFTLTLIATLLAVPGAARATGGASPAPERDDRSVLGAVLDTDGLPLIGAFVAAVIPGTSRPSAIAVTDVRGEFVIDGLAPGVYDVVAASIGFVGAVVQDIIVPRIEPVSLQLQAANRRSLAAVDAPIDLGWALRRRARDILRKEGVGADPREAAPTTPAYGRAVTASTMTPHFGEVSIWSHTYFADDESVGGATALALGSGVSGGEDGWEIAAQVSGGGTVYARTDLVRDLGGGHSMQAGFAYSARRLPEEPVIGTLAADPWVGAVYARDHWRVGGALEVEYGMRLEHHNYLSETGLLSPGIEVTYGGDDALRMFAGVAYDTEALNLGLGGSSREVDPLFDRANLQIVPVGQIVPERSMRYHVGFERDLSDDARLRVRAYYDDITDELVGLYLTRQEGSNEYLVANVGDATVRGLELAIAASFLDRFTGELAYAYDDRSGGSLPVGVAAQGASVAPLASRVDGLLATHELRARLGTAIDSLGTRVVAVYYWKRGLPVIRDGEMRNEYGRFDVRLRQRLPFRALDTEWAALVHVRNVLGHEYDGLFNVSLEEIHNLSRFVAGGLAVRF